MSTYSIILAWRIPWTEELVGYSSWGHIVGHDWATNTFKSLWSRLTENPFLTHMFVEENFVSWLPDGHYFFFFWGLFLLYFALQYCISFAMHWHESATGVHELPILNPPPTSHLISSLWIIPRAPAPSILYPVSNIDPHFISYLIVYMFQCHSPKLSHPHPLPQSLKVRSIHLCLFCCLVYRVIITIF